MTIRKFIALVILSLIILTPTYGQSKRDKSSVISQIKQAFRQINDYKNYKVVTIDDSEEFLGHGTDNGGSLKGFYKSDTLKKIVEWVGLSNRVVQNEYYFDKGKLVFCIQQTAGTNSMTAQENLIIQNLTKYFRDVIISTTTN